jgi:raffinose/stachyose/melibiose transport system permease protein
MVRSERQNREVAVRNIRIGVVEDDPASCQLVLDYLNRYQQENDEQFTVSVFDDGARIVEKYTPVYDILLLDIEMSEMDGMASARRIRERDDKVVIVFITAAPQYAISGYEVRALSYLLKPLPWFAFSQELKKSIDMVRRNGDDSMLIETSNGQMRLNLADILYLESIRHTIVIHTLEGKLSINGTLKDKDGIEKTNFIASFGWSLVITVGAVLLILLCTSMCAWWIVRVNNVASKIIYVLFLLNMIVPFQMVMFPLSKMADMLGLNTPWGVCLVYLGFGAGLPVFIFTGTIKSIPQEIEESAMIDGAGAVRTFFTIVVPMMRSSIITVAILQTMWIWNDYLLPYLTLDLQRFKTIPIVIQYLRGGYGSIDMGALMACLVLAIIPIVIFFALCQKYIIQGITAGAVKG